MLSKKIVYNSIISSGSRIAGLVISLVIIGFISRYLGQDGFGYYSTILAFLYFFTVLSDLGLYSISLREISRPGADQEKIASNAFTLRFFGGLLIFSFAPIVVSFFPYPVEIKLGVLIGAIGFWMMSNQQVLIGIFQKYLRMDKVSLAEFLSRLVQLLFVVFFIFKNLGFLFIISSVSIASFVSFFLTFIFARKYIKISLKFDFIFWEKLLKESLPLGAAVIFTMIYFKIDTLMLSVMKPAADVGIYNLAYKFMESLLFFPAMFVGLVMPIMSKYAFLSKEKFNEIVQQSLEILLIFIIPLVIGTLFLSDRIIILISGPEFILSSQVLNILVFAMGIIFLAVLFSNMLISIEKQKFLAYIYGFGAVFNFGANLYFIPRFSYYGAAYTTVLTELIVTLLMIFVLSRLLDEMPSFKLSFKYIISALVMAGFLYYFSDLNLFLSVFLSVLIYFSFLYLTGAFLPKNIIALIKKDD